MADQQQQPQQPASQEEMDAARGGGLNLPPGFRFHPSDDEIICDYLSRKVLNRDFTCTAIGEADLNKTEPWELPRKYTCTGAVSSLLLCMYIFIYIYTYVVIYIFIRM